MHTAYEHDKRSPPQLRQIVPRQDKGPTRTKTFYLALSRLPQIAMPGVPYYIEVVKHARLIPGSLSFPKISSPPAGASKASLRSNSSTLEPHNPSLPVASHPTSAIRQKLRQHLAAQQKHAHLMASPLAHGSDRASPSGQVFEQRRHETPSMHHHQPHWSKQRGDEGPAGRQRQQGLVLGRGSEQVRRR